MKKPEKIVRLIKSLSGPEKRYFKLFVQKNSIGESNHYMKLFDAFDKEGTSDIKYFEKLYDDDFIKNQFNVYKHLLYKQVLKSLRSYHAEKSVNDKILELIRDIKVLFDKALYEQASTILERAKSIALKYEKQILLLEIIKWEKKIINVSSIYGKLSENELNSIYEEEERTIEKIKNSSKYLKIRGALFLNYLANGVATEPEDIARYDSIMNRPFLKSEKFALTYDAKKDFYAIRATYYRAVNNLQEGYKYSKKLNKFIEAHPLQIEDEPADYVNNLNNLIYFTKKLKKYEELFSLTDKQKSLLKKYEIYSSALLRLYNIELWTYLDIGQFKKATQLLPEIDAELKKQLNIDELLEFLLTMNLSLLFFMNGDFQKSLNKLNHVLNNEKKFSRYESYRFAKIFQLIIHFEKENTDLLPYLVKSVYRYLTQRKQLNKAESALLKFIRSGFNRKMSNREQVENLKALKEELICAFSDPKESELQDYFDIISWLESKIEKRSFEEILREKSGIRYEL